MQNSEPPSKLPRIAARSDCTGAVSASLAYHTTSRTAKKIYVDKSIHPAEDPPVHILRVGWKRHSQQKKHAPTQTNRARTTVKQRKPHLLHICTVVPSGPLDMINLFRLVGNLNSVVAVGGDRFNCPVSIYGGFGSFTSGRALFRSATRPCAVAPPMLRQKSGMQNAATAKEQAKRATCVLRGPWWGSLQACRKREPKAARTKYPRPIPIRVLDHQKHYRPLDRATNQQRQSTTSTNQATQSTKHEALYSDM